MLFEMTAAAVCRRACRLCTDGVPHHTNATGSIGGADGRHAILDLHVGAGGGLVECEAGDLRLAWEGAMRRWGATRPGEGILAGNPRPADGGSIPPASTSFAKGEEAMGSSRSAEHKEEKGGTEQWPALG